ncbi:alpha/beta-hydrolase, partial [Thelephora ganbajun]
PLHLDIYPPDPRINSASISGDDGAGVPVVVYFHAGGLVNGNRRSWFPEWLHRRLSVQGVALLSADYRLFPPSTGHDVLEDIQDLFAYIRNNLNSALAEVTGNPKLRINVDAIGVAGTSAGGLCTYLCALHLSPKTRALLSISGLAGEVLNDNFLEPKTKLFFPNEPLLDPSDFTDFIFPQSASLPIMTGSPLEYHPPTHSTPSLPVTKRMYLFTLYYQLGEWLDYYTGDHTLSTRLCHLRSSRSSVSPGTQGPSPTLDPIKAREVIGEKNIGLFPQFGVAENWPPTLIVHGSEDSEVPLLESKHLAERLKAVGVESELIVVESQEHLFYCIPNAEKEFERFFDRATAFLAGKLQG